MKILIVLLILTLLFSCKKAEDRSCFKKEGANISKSILLEHYEKIYLKEHLTYVLVQDTIEKIIINGGENLVNFVESSVDNKTLSIQNKNRCNFLRYNSRKIKVYIHFKTLNSIHFEGTDSLTCQDTIDLSWLNLIIRDGGGSVDLQLNADHIYSTITNGYGDFKLSGSTNALNIFLLTNGYCDTYDLDVKDSINIETNTPSTCKIRANQSYLKGKIGGQGDVWYQGIPDSISMIELGTGKLINKN